MKSFLKTDRGAVPLGTVGVFAILLAAAGFALYQFENHKQPAGSKLEQHSSSPSPTPKIVGSLTISKLGIRVPLTAEVADLFYDYQEPNGDSPGYLYFSTSSIKKLPGKCSPKDEPLGRYIVYPAPVVNMGRADNHEGMLVVASNGYYVFYAKTQAACGDTAEAKATVAKQATAVEFGMLNVTLAPK